MASRKDLAQLLADPDTFTTTLIAITVNEYGTDSLQWSPATLQLELSEDFGVSVPRENVDKLTVGINLLLSDDFYKRLPFFIQACNVLSGSALTPDFDKADAAECAWGMTEAMLLGPPDAADESPFTDEIRYYLGGVLDEEGITNPPDLLQLALRNEAMIGSAAVEGLATEDPDMFAAAYGARADRSAEIAEMLQENINELLEQLQALPGSEGKEALLNKLRSK